MKQRLLLSVAVLLAVAALFYFYDLHQTRLRAMQQLTDDFIAAAQRGDAEAAYALFQPGVRAQLEPARFARRLERSGLAAMTLTTVADLNIPYKKQYGYRVFYAEDAAGQTHRFSLVFGGADANSPAWNRADYYVRRFSHDTANVRRALEQFIDWLNNGQTDQARKMAFIHRYDANGQHSHTLNGQELKTQARQLGLLDADRLHWSHPDHEGDRLRQQVTLVRNGQTRIVEFTLGVYPANPGSTDGLSILSMH